MKKYQNNEKPIDGFRSVLATRRILCVTDIKPKSTFMLITKLLQPRTRQLNWQPNFPKLDWL